MILDTEQNVWHHVKSITVCATDPHHTGPEKAIPCRVELESGWDFIVCPDLALTVWSTQKRGENGPKRPLGALAEDNQPECERLNKSPALNHDHAATGTKQGGEHNAAGGAHAPGELSDVLCTGTLPNVSMGCIECATGVPLGCH